jgi:very-short-patch-repair endonuclease
MKSKITGKARGLRGNQTPAERVLWDYLRRENLGMKVRRQQPLRVKTSQKTILFIADFYCREAKLVIEVDGRIHENQKDLDEAREYSISRLGFQVVRFSNEQVLNEINLVVQAIHDKISQRETLPETPLSPDLGKGVGG